ncbi:unnamed protein product [Rotaria sordida]|uniref:Uncharacterized protein n=1 Tax=Rotaria sordida TaxID=392033 RepID=A0A813SQB4_9BILA|nr:unnamed protein product [Rotaria sordida]CAF0800636.1 unnamed protein product [Rotaria sordida]CAF0813790.1 unnamed protein product [Rotaria sordida]
MMIVLILFLSVNGEQNKKEDEDIYGLITNTNILCIRDLLTNIAKAAKDIRKITNEIEQKIFQQDPTKLRLMKTIKHKE